MPIANSDPPNFAALLKEFQARQDNYVALMHVKVDWLEGTSDPTKSRFDLIAGGGISTEEVLAGGKPASPFDVPLDPEFWFSCWYDNSESRFYPNRRCKHWVTIRRGLFPIPSLIATWQAFRSIAMLAGDAALKLGLRPTIADPMQRWLIVLHDTIKPERMYAPEIGKRNPADEPVPDSIRLDDMEIIQDRMGCAFIDDLHEASCKACEALMRGLSRQTKTGNSVDEQPGSLAKQDDVVHLTNESQQVNPPEGEGGQQGDLSLPANANPPTAEAMTCYRVFVATGMTQQSLADRLSKEFGRPITQGQVSKWIKRVEKWLTAGNVLPNLPEPLGREPPSIDPNKIDMGERQDNRTPRQRDRRSADSDD